MTNVHVLQLYCFLFITLKMQTTILCYTCLFCSKINIEWYSLFSIFDFGSTSSILVPVFLRSVCSQVHYVHSFAFVGFFGVFIKLYIFGNYRV